MVKIFKKISGLLIICLSVISCSELIQDSNPAFQSFIDSELFRATSFVGTRGVAGGFVIEGLTSTQALKIRISGDVPGVYSLGESALSNAVFEDVAGNKFFTNPNGEGQVTITEVNMEERYITGNFDFKAKQFHFDSINVRNGVFYNVPFIQEITPEVIEPTLPVGLCDAGTFVALINGETFGQETGLCVSGVTFQDQIVITATDSDEKVQLRVPINVGVGSVSITEEDYGATYTNLITGETREAIIGAIIILNQNTEAHLLKGTFVFNTSVEQVSAGGFNVVYQ